jgi:6-phosphogluconate dehydrogenase
MHINPQQGIGVVGLGKMGVGVVENLDEQGYSVVGYDPSEESRNQANVTDGTTVGKISDLVSGLPKPRVIWMMVPHGAVDQALDDLREYLDAGDVVIDAGNSDYRETKRRAGELTEADITLVDAGVSGGPEGARHGSAIMVGGPDEVVGELSGLFADLAKDGGFWHTGPSGAGHFTKTVHNGIEYGILQSIAEGFTLLKEGPYDIDPKTAAEVYANGSVIQSQLIDMLEDAFAEYGTDLDDISSRVEAGGTGHWTVREAKAFNVPHEAIESAVDFRDQSEENGEYAGRIIMALRSMFGGHNPHSDSDQRG